MSISRTDTTRTTGIQTGLRTSPGSHDFSDLSHAANNIAPGSVGQLGQELAPDGDQLAYCVPCLAPAVPALESALGWTILGTGAVVGGATIMESRGRNNGGEDRAEHTKGKRNSTKDKHTKPRSGRTTTKQRSKPGWFQR